MLENRPAYEPALEIIAETHDIDIDASHHSDHRLSDREI